MTFQEYTGKKEKVIRQLETMMPEVKEEKLERDIKEKIDHLKKDRFVISVFGHFSNGKSSFLNALMGFGEEVLKEDDVASTAALTRIKYAEDAEKTNKAEVYRYNGTVETVPIKELKEYVARNTSVDVEQTIREVVLFLQSDYLKNGVEIVDTPGLNSTYKLHTEIALRQVENSDAAIFMFNYEKPGAYHEFQLLKRIRKYMDRVFFILNKIDLADNTERIQDNEDLVEAVIKDILNKMTKEGIPVDGKVIYPISARWAKEGIREKDTELFRKSRLPDFTDVLSRYLTSEENIRDRIDAPLKSLDQSVQKELDRINDLLDACEQDKETLKRELDRRKAEIKEHEKTLKSKRTNIRGAVNSEISKRKSDVEEAAEDVMEDVRRQLDKVNTKFSLHLKDFTQITYGANKNFQQRWERTASELEDNLISIIDTNVDADEEYKRLEDRVRKIIRSNLFRQEIEVADPRFDYGELKEIDREIEEIKKVRDQTQRELESIYIKKDRREELLKKRKDLQQKLKDSIERKERKIESLSHVDVYRGQRTETKTQKRKGFFGVIGNFLFGDKTLYEIVDFKDESQKKEAEDKIRLLERDILNMQDAEELRELDDTIAEYGGLDYRQGILEAENTVQEQEYLDKVLKSQEEKDTLEQQIIKYGKEDYLFRLGKAIEEEADVICSFLSDSKDGFINIMNTVLEQEAEKIVEERDNLMNIISINSKSPSEIDGEQKELRRRREMLEEAKDNLEKARDMGK